MPTLLYLRWTSGAEGKAVELSSPLAKGHPRDGQANRSALPQRYLQEEHLMETLGNGTTAGGGKCPHVAIRTHPGKTPTSEPFPRCLTLTEDEVPSFCVQLVLE